MNTKPAGEEEIRIVNDWDDIEPEIEGFKQTKEERAASIAARQEMKRTADSTCAEIALAITKTDNPVEKKEWGEVYQLQGCQKSPKFKPRSPSCPGIGFCQEIHCDYCTRL